MGFVNELTGTQTGFSEDGKAVRVYDPTTGEYVWKGTGGNALDWNPSGDKTNWAYNQDGERVLMYTPEGYEEYGGYNPEFEGGWQVGYQPPPLNRPPTNGMGPDGGQREGETVTPPVTRQPGSGGGGADGGGDPFAPGGGSQPPSQLPEFNWGSGGVGGVAAPSEVDTPFDVDPFNPANQIGFGNSTNRDFYRLQSAAQRAQGFRNAMREDVARNRAAESFQDRQNASTITQDDMWDWAGGADQFRPGGEDPFAPGGGDGSSSSDWYMTRPWEGGVTTNADLIRMYMDMPQFEKYDRIDDWISQQEAGGGAEWGTWNPNSGNPNPFASGSPFITDLFDAMWSTGGQPTGGQ